MSIWAYNAILCVLTMVLICFSAAAILWRLDEIEKLLRSKTMKLIDVDKLQESLEFNLKVYQALADKQTPVNAKFVVADLKGFLRMIDEAPDLNK